MARRFHPLAQAYWLDFGEQRFTMTDIYNQLQRGWGYPSHDFRQYHLAEMAQIGIFEEAPGPRGGEGWRIHPDFVAALRKKYGEPNARLPKKNGKSKTNTDSTV